MAKRGLGKGLEALLPSINKNEDLETEIEISRIDVSSFQPRKHFEEDKLAELATSIREHGVVQPVVVRPLEDGRYQLIAGERRWRACKILNLDKIPAVVKEVGEAEAREISLVENLQRENLNPLEEAEAYHQLMQEFEFTQEELARRIGKSRSYIANSLRLRGLSEWLKERLIEGDLTAGHAKVLLSISNEEDREYIGRQVVQRGLSVRETENLIRQIVLAQKKDVAETDSKSIRKKSRNNLILRQEIELLEKNMQSQLAMPVRIKWDEKKGGEIKIKFTSIEQLKWLEKKMIFEE